MEKIRQLTIISSLKNFMQQMKSEGMNPNLVWRIILGLSFVAIGVVSAGGYFALNWAQDASQNGALPKREREALSPEDLHGVVQFYELKESTYESLHQNVPVAPNLKMVFGGQSSIVPENATSSGVTTGTAI